MSEQYQNIIVIGASGAGRAVVNSLVPTLPGEYRILLIDQLDFAFWPLGALRAAVNPGWEERISAPLRTSTIFPSHSQHQVVAPNKVIKLSEHFVTLEKPFEGSTEIPFFRCIVATGASQPMPMKPVPGSTEEEYKATLCRFQSQVSRVTKFVIVGAGAVGLETAAEIKLKHPNSQVTIVTSGPHVLNPYTTKSPVQAMQDKAFSYSSPPTTLKLSQQLEKTLRSLKINLITSDKVNIPSDSAEPDDWDGSFGLQSGVKKVYLSSGKIFEADYVFISVGNKPNIDLMQTEDEGAIASGLVAVDEYLKVKSKKAGSVFTLGSFYAVGDCCSSSGWKTMQSAITDGELCAGNILAEINGQNPKPWNGVHMAAMAIPLGPKLGHGTLQLPWIGVIHMPAFMVSSFKGVDLFVKMLFLPSFKGTEKTPLALREGV